MSLLRHRRIRITGIKPQKEVCINRKARDIDVRVQGYDNTIRIATDSFRGSVSVYGVGNTVVVEEGVRVGNPCSIILGSRGVPCFNCSIIIRRKTYLGEVELKCAEDGSSIEIGENCLFAHHIRVWCSDGHTIRREDGSVNVGRCIRIGSHVWVGLDVKIGKNTVIADDCMVGWGSVVTGRFEEPHCLLAGVPARICRHGITWDEKRPMDYAGHPCEPVPGLGRVAAPQPTRAPAVAAQAAMVPPPFRTQERYAEAPQVRAQGGGSPPPVGKLTEFATSSGGCRR